MIKNKIKCFIEKKTKGDNKKMVENLIIFLVLLIITIISINIIWGGDNSGKVKQTEESSYKVLAQEVKESNISETTAYDLEEKLENILSSITGVGKVQVLVTYSETSEIIALQNETKNTSRTEESDSARRNEKNRNIRREQRNNSRF